MEENYVFEQKERERVNIIYKIVIVCRYFPKDFLISWFAKICYSIISLHCATILQLEMAGTKANYNLCS